MQIIYNSAEEIGLPGKKGMAVPRGLRRCAAGRLTGIGFWLTGGDDKRCNRTRRVLGVRFEAYRGQGCTGMWLSMTEAVVKHMNSSARVSNGQLTTVRPGKALGRERGSEGGLGQCWTALGRRNDKLDGGRRQWRWRRCELGELA